MRLIQRCRTLTSRLPPAEPSGPGAPLGTRTCQFLPTSPGATDRPDTPAWPPPFRSAVNALLTVLLAPACAACRAPLAAPLDGPVCEACWGAIVPITPPVCDGCGDPLPSWRIVSCETARCPRCRRAPRAVDRGRAIGAYDGALREIVHALKYDGRRSVAPRLARLMRERAGDLLVGIDCVVPVPLHRRRQRARGFNQAAELAAAIGPPVRTLLRRVRHTAAQVDLPAARRHANVRDAFGLAATHGRPTRADASLAEEPPEVVLLVDDVCTTGATLEACARVLKEAGVREVRALTVARAVRRGRS